MNPRQKNPGVESRAGPEVTDPTGNLYFLLQDSFWAQNSWGFGTLGQGLVIFPVCAMASTHAVQIQTQGGHRQASASDLIFLVVCGEKRIVPCLPKQASGVWCVSLYTVRQGEVCMVYKYARACNTALIAQLYRRQR